MTIESDPGLGGLAVYNPRLLSKAELVRGFVARGPLLERLTDALRREVDAQPQHHVIVGARGMGKTTLLHRLRFAIEDDAALGERCLGLTFPEEQYNVASLADLWLNCADALADQLQASGESEIAEEIDRWIAEVQGETSGEGAGPASDERRDRALALLRTVANRIHRRLVLLIDNIDLVFDRLEAEQWGLREVLSAEPWIQLIGASSAPLESYYRHDRAFYDFFRVEHLRGLSEDETFETLRGLARNAGSERVERIIDEQPARIKTLHLMAGGNPRTLVVLFGLLSQGIDGDVRTDVERLLDACTPLYKHRVEVLSVQSQRVLDGVAMLWFPATAGEIAAAVRLEVNKTSTHLSRLVKDGTLEKVTLPDTKKHGFQLAERFFNIWYLMRSSRRVRRRLGWFVDFLRLMLSPEELRQRAREHVRGLGRGDSLRSAEMGIAYAGAVDDANLRHALETHSLRSLCADPDHRRKLAEFFDLEGEDVVLRDRAQRMRMLAEGRDVLRGVGSDELGRNGEECWTMVARSLIVSVARKHAFALRVGADPSSAMPLLEALDEETPLWLELFDPTEFEALASAVERGYFDPRAPTIEDIASAGEAYPAMPVVACAVALVHFRGEALAFPFNQLDRAAQASRSALCWTLWAEQAAANAKPRMEVATALKAARARADWSSRALVLVGNVLADHLQLFEEAEETYRDAIDLDPASADPWQALADLLGNCLRRCEEAAAAYRAAIARDPTRALPWNGLGNVLAVHLARYEEAEIAYREAIARSPSSAIPRHGLGNLLANYLGRYEEAETTYRQAIECDPTEAYPWHGLANVLAYHLERYEEAEAAYREAIARNQSFSSPWTGLGNVLAVHLKRYDEAEAAYRAAIDRDPLSAAPWNGLGNVLADHAGRYEEAEAAYRQAIACDASSPIPWNGLGNVLMVHLARYEDAEEAYRNAIGCEMAFAPAWNGLGNLLKTHFGRYEEAAAAYRQAISIDPSSAIPWNGLGNVLAEFLGRYEEAEAAYRAAIVRDSSASHPRHGLGDLLRIHLGRYDEAEEAYRGAIACAPRRPELYLSLARLLYDSGRSLDDVAAVARDAVGLDPSPQATCLLATILVARGEWEEARSWASTFLSADAGYFAANWSDVLGFFEGAVRSGFASEARELVAEIGARGRWEPLDRALELLARDELAAIGRLSPEMRTAVEMVLAVIAPNITVFEA